MTSATLQDAEQKLVVESLQRVAADLSMVTDRTLAIQSVSCEHAAARPAGRDSVHISFKIAAQRGDTIVHGAVLIPYRPAVSLAAGILMLDEAESLQRQADADLDPSLKDALLEIGNFVASGMAAALRTMGRTDVRVVSEGCQGVRAGVRPALSYVEGTDLAVGRARAKLDSSEPFEIVMMLPPIG